MKRPTSNGKPLNITHLMILEIAGEQIAPTMTMLARECGVSTAAMTGAVERLREDGLVEATRGDPRDKRKVMVMLTQAGRDFATRKTTSPSPQVAEEVAHEIFDRYNDFSGEIGEITMPAEALHTLALGFSRLQEEIAKVRGEAKMFLKKSNDFIEAISKIGGGA